MANRAAHDMVGVGAGALAALWHAEGSLHTSAVLEVFGGCVGGFVGSRLPDVLDPPTSPNHRHIAHGAVTAGVVGRLCVDQLPAWQKKLRDLADDLAARRAEITSDLGQLWNQLLEAVCRVLAGAMAGLLGGYSSHLLLDFVTPKGLPLFARGF